jgi:hypothetical protein
MKTRNTRKINIKRGGMLEQIYVKYSPLLKPSSLSSEERIALCGNIALLNEFKKEAKKRAPQLNMSPNLIDVLLERACPRRTSQTKVPPPPQTGLRLTNPKTQPTDLRLTKQLAQKTKQGIKQTHKHSNNSASMYKKMIDSIDWAIKYGERRDYSNAKIHIDESIKMLETLSSKPNLPPEYKLRELGDYVQWLNAKISEDIRRTAAAAPAAAASGVTQGQALPPLTHNNIDFTNMGNNNLANIARDLTQINLTPRGGSRKKSRNRSKRKKSRNRSNRKKSRKKSRRR